MKTIAQGRIQNFHIPVLLGCTYLDLTSAGRGLASLCAIHLQDSGPATTTNSKDSGVCHLDVLHKEEDED